MSKEEIKVSLEADVSDFISKMEQASKAMDKMDKGASTTGKSVGEAGKSASEAGGLFGKFGGDVLKGMEVGLGMNVAGMVTGMKDKIVDFVKESIKTGSEFEASMSTVKAITNATEKEMGALEGVARQLGATTSRSAREAGDAMQFLGMAGYDTNEIMSALPGILDLSIASGSEFKDVADIVTDNLTAFGKEADYAGKYSDQLAYAITNANVNMENLGSSLKYVAPVAKSTGFSIEDTVSAVMALGDAGIKGSQAGTTLRTMMLHLSGANERANKTLKDLGIEVYNADGKIKPFSEIIGLLSEKFKTLDDDQKSQIATNIVGKNAVSGFLSIVEGGADKVANYSNELAKADGTAERMARTMEDNLKGSVDKFKSSVEELQIQIFEGLEPALRGVVDAGTVVVSAINDSSKTFEVFGVQVDETTQGVLGSVNKVVEELDTVAVKNKAFGYVTAEDLKSLKNSYKEQYEDIVAIIKSNMDGSNREVALGLLNKNIITKEDFDKEMATLKERGEQQLQRVEALETEKNLLMAKYNGQRNTMTEEDLQRLNNIEKEMAQIAINNTKLSNEQRVAMIKSLGENQKRISKETADELIKNAKNRMEEDIKAIEAEAKAEQAYTDQLYANGEINIDEWNERTTAISEHAGKAKSEIETAYKKVKEDIHSNTEQAMHSSVKHMNAMDKNIGEKAGDINGHISGMIDWIGKLIAKPIKLAVDNSGLSSALETAKGWLNSFTGKTYTAKVVASATNAVKSSGSIVPYSALGMLSAVSNSNTANTQTIQLQGNWQVRSEDDIHAISKGIAREIQRFYY